MCLLRGELGPRPIQCGLRRGLLRYQVASSSIQPFGHNRHGPKIGWGVPFSLGWAGSPSKTKSPGPRPTGLPQHVTSASSVYFSQTSEDSSLPALLSLTVCIVPQQWRLSFSDTLIVRVTYLWPRSPHGANGWMDEDATWYGRRPPRRPHCIRWVPTAPRKGYSTRSLFGQSLLWPRSPISATAELLLYLKKWS